MPHVQRHLFYAITRGVDGCTVVGLHIFDYTLKRASRCGHAYIEGDSSFFIVLFTHDNHSSRRNIAKPLFFLF